MVRPINESRRKYRRLKEETEWSQVNPFIKQKIRRTIRDYGFEIIDEYEDETVSRYDDNTNIRYKWVFVLDAGADVYYDSEIYDLTDVIKSVAGAGYTVLPFEDGGNWTITVSRIR